MKTPKYRIGDRVIRKSTGVIATVIYREWQPQQIGMPALIQRTDGNWESSKTTLAATWKYKLEGFSYWFYESILDSAEPCCSCFNNGWDWEFGCNNCNLQPEDVSDCDECEGTGTVRVFVNGGFDADQCPECNGFGYGV